MLHENTVEPAWLCLPLVSSALISLCQPTCPAPAVTKSAKKINKRCHKTNVVAVPWPWSHSGPPTTADGQTWWECNCGEWRHLR